MWLLMVSLPVDTNAGMIPKVHWCLSGLVVPVRSTMDLEFIFEVMFSALLTLQLPLKSTCPEKLTRDMVKLSGPRKRVFPPSGILGGMGQGSQGHCLRGTVF